MQSPFLSCCAAFRSFANALLTVVSNNIEGKVQITEANRDIITFITEENGKHTFIDLKKNGDMFVNGSKIDVEYESNINSNLGLFENNIGLV